jgi:hypothetical protein
LPDNSSKGNLRMKIHTKTVFQLTDDPLVYLPVSDESYEYDGPIARFDGEGDTPAPTLGIVPVQNQGGPATVVDTTPPATTQVQGSDGQTYTAVPTDTRPAPPRSFGGDFKGGLKSAANPQMKVDPDTGQMTRVNPPQGAGGILGSILYGALSGAAKGMGAQPAPGAKGKGAALASGFDAASKAQDEKQEKAQKLADQQFQNNRAILKDKDTHNQAVMTQLEATRRMAHEDVEEPLVLERLGVDLDTSKNNREISRQALADHQRQIGEDIDNRIGTEPVGRINLGRTPSYGEPEKPQQPSE